MKQILESIEQYTLSLEQRLAALEGAVSVLQTQLSLSQAKNQEQARYVASLEARVAALEEEMRNIEWVEEEELAEEPSAAPQPIVEETVHEDAPAEDPQEERVAAEEQLVPEVYSEVQTVETQVLQEETVEEQEELVAVEATAETPKASVYGKPVDDIKQAIALGDRFLFQRELFRQNAEQMQRTFMDINALHSFDEAIAYLDKRFDWDKESTTYALFITALHRRFPG